MTREKNDKGYRDMESAEFISLHKNYALSNSLSVDEKELLK